MERKEENKLPEFQSLEEEKEYWEARGPLAEGRKGRINKPKADQKRSSFLSVRLTGEEITSLREVAAIFYTTPSELARGAILDSVKQFKSLHEMAQKEQKKLEEALRYGLSYPSIKPLDLVSQTSEATLGDTHLYWKRIIEDNPKMALYHTALLILENLIGGSDKSISTLIQELDNRLSRPERVTK
jgi:hypothetical protein